MSWPNHVKDIITAKLAGYTLYFSPAEVPPSVEYPQQWHDFGYQNGDGRVVPKNWSSFEDCLPWVSSWLSECVIGTLLAVSDEPLLVYAYRKASNIYLYVGGVPLSRPVTDSERFSSLPCELKSFYTQLHNGFGFYVGGTMGPSRFEDFEEVDNLCDEDDLTYPGMLAVFSNGGGDYICIDEKNAGSQTMIWWHEEPENPTKDIELWSIMDTWMSIFLENSELKCV